MGPPLLESNVMNDFEDYFGKTPRLAGIPLIGQDAIGRSQHVH